MKARYLIISIVLLIVLADQCLKFYIKTSFLLNTAHPVAGSWFQLYLVKLHSPFSGWAQLFLARSIWVKLPGRDTIKDLLFVRRLYMQVHWATLLIHAFTG